MKEKQKQNKTRGGKILKPIAIAGLSLAMACSLSACGKDKSSSKDPEVPAIIWTADNAYTQAKAEGFTGTFEEFLATLAGITKVETDSNGHLKVTLSDGSVVDAGKVTGEKGEKGNDGANGKDGVSVTGITKTHSNGLVDTYTITLSNGHSETFTVTNGRNGQNGVNGQNGKDGVNGKDGEKGDKGDDGIGIAKIESKTDRWGLVTTTTYTYTDSTSENPHIEVFEVNNGAQFGRLYDVRTSEEISYLLKNGVTNFALLNDIEVSETATLKATDVGVMKKVQVSENEGQPVYENIYLNYEFNLNGYTLTVPSTYPLSVEDGLNVMFENGTLIGSEESLKFNSEKTSINFNEDVNFKFGVVSAAELVSAAQVDDAEIVLLSDIETDENFVFIRKITLDFNGKTLKGDGSNGVILAGIGADVTITGNGTIIAKESSDRYAMAVHAIINSKVTIESGTFTQEITGTDDQYDLIYLEGSAQVTILDGTFKCHTPKWTLNKKDYDVKTAKIIVKGGTFENYNPAKSESESPVENFVAEGYESILVDGSSTNYKVVKKEV